MPEELSDFSRNEARLAAFTGVVWEHHRLYRRDLPWRRTHDPYEILVSEIMLQQTQVARVLDKWPQFLAAFPTAAGLAAASVGAVLAMWQGLGYNRRALALHRAARIIVERHSGQVPNRVEDLRRLPGVGAATAAAVSAFAFGRAEPFIETNIRAAFIHFFFPDTQDVSDSDLLPLITQTIDRNDPREWFYALMDYGVWVKREFGNPSRRSKHHTVQSPFPGSRRQVRAQILAVLLSIAPTAARATEVATMLPGPPRDPEQLVSLLDELVREGFLGRDAGAYSISSSQRPSSS